jgi:DNA modification methylase
MSFLMSNLADLKPDKKNARKHNPRNIGMISNALREVGASRSGVIDEDGNILAGNGTYEALSEAGIDKVKIVQADGNEWVVVQRKGLSEEQKLKLALYDNRSAELAEWDKDVLADIDPAIMESMFSTDELDDLLDDVGGGELEDEDSVPEAPEKAITQLGDLYQLGGHRLLCGDSGSQENAEILMNGDKVDSLMTDPPYGVDYSAKNEFLNAKDKGNRNQKAIANDAIDDYREFFGNFLKAIPFADYNTVYIFMSGQELHTLRMAVEDAGIKWGDYLVWVKNNHVLGRKDYNAKHEFILYGWKGKHKFYSGHRTTVIEENKPLCNDLHPTMKPIALLEQLIPDGSPKGGKIYDPFGGSGSTLIACEKLNRKCYMMELDEQYCDVIVKRFNDLFPEKEILRNGEAFQPL